MGAAILSGVLRRRTPPPSRPTRYPKAAAASAAVAKARQVAALGMGMWTESDASLDLQVLPLMLAANAARAATRSASMGESAG
eukprot:3267996-Pyramimonas_sp.AAC.1